MFYEAIDHRTRTVESAIQAATLIHTGNVHSYDALVWEANDRRLCAVADGGLNNPWFEVAVIDLNRMVQIESLTVGWMKTLDRKIEYFQKCETTNHSMGETQFPLDGNGESLPATFTCGCCGESFESSLAEQRVFDQDEGYGTCKSCLKR